jgi:hypothetical protein
MPFRDLRTGNNEIDPLGPFIVLAVMCYPQASEHAERGRMVSTLRRHTGVGKVRRGLLSNEAFLDAVAYRTARGSACGSLLLTYLQLSELGEHASLNRAVSVVRCYPPRWSDHLWPVYDAKAVHMHMPHSRRKMLEAFHHYLPVAHLWAALLHGYQNERNDISPASPSTLPTFLAYADRFLQLAEQTHWAGLDRKVLLPGSLAWRFGLPARFAQSISLEATPISTPPTCR